MISSFCHILFLLFQHIRGVFCSEWFQQDFSSSLASEKHWMAAAREGPGWRRFLWTQLFSLGSLLIRQNSHSSESLSSSSIWATGPFKCQQLTSAARPMAAGCYSNIVQKFPSSVSSSSFLWSKTHFIFVRLATDNCEQINMQKWMFER